MNHDLDVLIEMLDILAEHLLYDGDFCGSVAGRRLHDLRRMLISKSPQSRLPGTTERWELVNRNLVLPLELDHALTVAVDQSGLSRDTLIAGAIEAMIAEKRLV
jgi:hypothetical protein